MNIPDLPPDLSFPKLGTSPEDQEFAFEVKRAAIGPYIIQRWGGTTTSSVTCTTAGIGRSHSIW